MTTPLDTIKADAEKLFPPRPGGLVDTMRQQKQDEQDQAAALAATPETAGKVREIPVTSHAGELARGRTFVVSTSGNSIVEVLGRDDDRRNAVIMTLDEPVVVCFSQSAADDPRNASAGTAGQGAGGAVIPVNVPYPVDYRGVVWVAATNSTATRVSVASYSFSPPAG